MGLAFEQFAAEGGAVPTKADEPPAPPELTAEAALPEGTDEKDAIERIAAALEAATSDADRVSVQAVAAAARALGEAAETLLPALARDGFAPCLAETARQIAERLGEAPALRLAHAPGDRDAIEAALAGLPAQPNITLDEDPVREPGTAELSWPDGGARIDIEAMTATALEEARRRLDGATL